MKYFKLFLLILLCFISSDVEAREINHQARTSRTVLDNGLVALVVEEPQSEVVAIEYIVLCGVSQEGSNLQGYNNLILQILKNRVISDESGDDVVEITGSLVDCGASKDFSRLHAVTTTANANFIFNRLLKAITDCNFTEKEVETARQQMLNLMGENGGTSSQLYDIFLSCFYRLHPYKRSVQGVPVILKRVTAAEVSQYFRQNFSADRTVLAVAGAANSHTIFETVRQKCKNMLPSSSRKSLEIQWEPKAEEREVYLHSRSELAWVLIGYQAPPLYSPDYQAMKVIYGVLGSGLSSRLWLELRENRGLAYEVGARYPELTGPSHLLCHIITKPTSTGLARRRMLAEIDKIKREGISQQELSDTKEKLLGAYLLERETLSGKILHLCMAELAGRSYQEDARSLQDLERVTVEDVKRVANRYLVEPTIIVARPGGRLYFE